KTNSQMRARASGPRTRRLRKDPCFKDAEKCQKPLWRARRRVVPGYFHEITEPRPRGSGLQRTLFLSFWSFCGISAKDRVFSALREHPRHVPGTGSVGG